MIKAVCNVVAHVTGGRDLPVFSHPHAVEAGIQVPTGTMDPVEPHEQAVIREAREETGLARRQLRAHLGVRNLDFTPSGRDEIRCRHCFHRELEGDAPERWRHFERSPSEAATEPIEIELFWVGFPDQVPELKVGLGDPLHPVEGPHR